ncbi:ERD4 [Scenedesmus sp. PABB004]|nr:ERD4 [Scenedesmus sp. PABB004]
MAGNDSMAGLYHSPYPGMGMSPSPVLDCKGNSTCEKTNPDSINGVFTALTVNAIIGGACLLGFLLLRPIMKQYSLRLHLPSITIRPPPLPTKGLGKYFGWIKPVLTTSDGFILRSAGLDALVLQKGYALGVQMLLPMAIFGCCLLLPLQTSEAFIVGDASYSRVTMANIRPNSTIMWAHWVSCFLFLGWTFLLLEYHTRQYAAVRQHYLRGGDDPNYWRDLHMSEADGTHVHRSAKLLDVLGAARYDSLLDEQEEMLRETVGRRRWWNRWMRSLTSWTGQEGVEAAARHTVATDPSHIDLAHDVIQGDFHRDAVSFKSRTATSDDVVLTVPDAQSATRGGGAGAGGDGRAGGGADSSVSASRFNSEEDAARRDEKGEDIGSLVAFKWWSHVDHVAAADGKLRRLTEEESAVDTVKKVMLAKPSVRYRKTVNAVDRHGHRTAVNAQQYAVLVTNHLRARRGQVRRAGPRRAAAAVRYELEGPTAGHAAAEATPGGGKDVEAGGHGVTGPPSPRGPPRSGAELWARVRLHRESGALRALGVSSSYSMVASIFSALFPHDFDRVVPVFNYRRVDLLMRVWDRKQGQLEHALFMLERTGKRPVCNTSCCKGPKVDKINKLRAEIAALEPRILAERAAALQYGMTPSWFVLFRSQTAAAIAASCNILPMNQDLFQVRAPAPGPEEVNWESLWFNHGQRVLRGWLTVPAVVFVVLLPVSLLTSAISSLNSQFCAAVNWEFYCRRQDFVGKALRGLVTGFLPSLLVTLWQGLALPRLVYMIAQSEGRHLSLSAVDRRMGEIYFLWDIFNMFLQGVLGSAAVSTATGANAFMQTKTFAENPQEVPNLLGQALPASSKFFFIYVIMRTLMTVPLRFLITQPGVWQCWLRLMDMFPPCRGPVPPRTTYMRHAIRSPRYGVEFGSSLLVMLICLSFSIIAPLIVVLGVGFFAGMWAFWRYQLIFNYQRKYEAGGLLWPFYANRVLVCTFITVAFTGCVMIVKRAFVQASLLWVGGFIGIIAFRTRLNRRYMNAIAEMPLMLAALAPRARVPPTAYVPPPLQANGLGWYPEFNKVWEWFGMPGYSY